MTNWKVPPLTGVPDHLKPTVDVRGDHTFWEQMCLVNAALKRARLFDKAEEFRAIAVSECDGDNGMLLMLALNYVWLPGQNRMEDINDD